MLTAPASYQKVILGVSKSCRGCPLCHLAGTKGLYRTGLDELGAVLGCELSLVRVKCLVHFPGPEHWNQHPLGIREGHQTVSEGFLGSDLCSGPDLTGVSTRVQQGSLVGHSIDSLV